MTKKSVEAKPSDGSALKHNPFSMLAKNTALTAKLQNSLPAPTVVQKRPTQAQPPPRLSMRLESKGRGGKVVTRISGLPRDLLETVASRLRKALGCGANVEGEDVILTGSLKERATEWLERVGDVRKLAKEATAVVPSKPLETAPRSSSAAAKNASATQRENIRRGLRVAIVMKADQDTGKLTEGVVRDLLTNSAEHPRGIKVRLESGEVGRVKILFE